MNATRDVQTENGTVRVATSADTDGRLLTVTYFPDPHRGRVGLAVSCRDLVTIHCADDCLDASAMKWDFIELSEALADLHPAVPDVLVTAVRRAKL